ncbi:MAG: TonB family protein [Litorivivens sp.]|jgi:TonB family protein
MKFSVHPYLFLIACLLALTCSSTEASAQEKELVVLESADQMPQFKKGNKEFTELVQSNLIYPKLAIAQGISGEVLVMFVVDDHGDLTEYEIIEGIDLECDMAAIKSINLTSGMWVSGIQNGKNVNVYTTARVLFHLPKAKTTIQYAENPAEYKNGEEGLLKFLQENVRYPQSAIDQGLQGKVFVKFIVDIEGRLSDFEILQGVSLECNTEAIRTILETDGDWIPATHEGKKENVFVTIPVIYKVLLAPEKE